MAIIENLLQNFNLLINLAVKKSMWHPCPCDEYLWSLFQLKRKYAIKENVLINLQTNVPSVILCKVEKHLVWFLCIKVVNRKAIQSNAKRLLANSTNYIVNKFKRVRGLYSGGEDPVQKSERPCREEEGPGPGMVGLPSLKKQTDRQTQMKTILSSLRWRAVNIEFDSTKYIYFP